ncbi:pentatricopeptide repeat-containing protein [Tripterygium wilfordii]|uniref:Pentatricopeptide repeat-containing protein n=1 Tax=Tripterygium wilfordii TaxID=458696 RepID=A0A7J7D012_TRIWF|nr:pentatricopeptide repeat-containing protein At4g18520, chloroplastic [Tripterygium wilfordii]KAF5739705.1 pentatricopeptide repeat-containing protein [Tripterygium wilfordii]
MLPLTFLSLNSTFFQLHASLFAIQPPQFPKLKSTPRAWYCNFRNPENFQCFSYKNPSSASHFHGSITTPSSNEDHVADLPDTSSVSQCPVYGVLARWIRSSRKVEDLKTIHARAFKCLRYHMVYVDNNLISKYIRFGKLADARKVFDKMSKPNIVSWTAIINGYLSLGSDDEAFWLFNAFLMSGVRANGRMYVCLLNMCGKRVDYELGKQIHACAIKGDWRNLIVDSAVVCFYVQCGKLTNAFCAFDQMTERDVVCWTAIITACSQQGQGEKAFAMFSQMISDGFSPNEFTACSVLKACGEEKSLRFGRQLHGAIMKNVYKNDVFIGTSLVDMYAKCGEISDSRKVFDRMLSKNMVTWTSIIGGYAREGLGEEAISLFQVMKRRRLVANNLTVVSILRACGSIGALQTGREVHAQIVKNSLQSNVYLGSTLVWFYCKCGESLVASKVLHQIPSRDVISWTAIISGHTGFGHEPEALEFLKEMMEEGVEPNSFTYSSALKACANLEAVKHGQLIHSLANKMPELSNVFVGSALIQMYAKCGYLSDAIQVFDSMEDRNSVSWKSMIMGYARNGNCGEALKLIYQMQAEGFEVDDYVLSKVITSGGDLNRETKPSSNYYLQSS